VGKLNFGAAAATAAIATLVGGMALGSSSARAQTSTASGTYVVPPEDVAKLNAYIDKMVQQFVKNGEHGYITVSPAATDVPGELEAEMAVEQRRVDETGFHDRVTIIRGDQKPAALLAEERQGQAHHYGATHFGPDEDVQVVSSTAVVPAPAPNPPMSDAEIRAAQLAQARAEMKQTRIPSKPVYTENACDSDVMMIRTFFILADHDEVSQAIEECMIADPNALNIIKPLFQPSAWKEYMTKYRNSHPKHGN
jgi:hypothetical protein